MEGFFATTEGILRCTRSSSADPLDRVRQNRMFSAPVLARAERAPNLALSMGPRLVGIPAAIPVIAAIPVVETELMTHSSVVICGLVPI